MSGRKYPWFKFFASDWLADPALQSCSLAARGVWADLLSLMYRCASPGVLADEDGGAWSDARVVGSVRGNPSEVRAALNELLDRKVARRNPSGAIYSKRMVADCLVRDTNADRMHNRRTMAAQSLHNARIVQKSSAYASVSDSDSVLDGGCGGKPKPDPEFPAGLDTPDFRAAWAEWLAYRRERRLAKLVPRTVSGTFRRLSAIGPERAARAIRHSMDNGWQSINEERITQNGINRNAPTMSHNRSEYAEPPPDLSRALGRGTINRSGSGVAGVSGA